MSDKADNLVKHIEETLAKNPEKAINIQSYIDKAAIDILLGKKKRNKNRMQLHMNVITNIMCVVNNIF